MDAKEAALRSEKVRREREEQEQQRRAEEHANHERKIEALLPTCAKEVEEGIAAAVEKGESSYTTSSFSLDLAHRLATHFRKKGFRAHVSEDTINYGDSAAPCNVDMVYLEVKWGSE